MMWNDISVPESFKDYSDKSRRYKKKIDRDARIILESNI
jgi:hypothetical protein